MKHYFRICEVLQVFCKIFAKISTYLLIFFGVLLEKFFWVSWVARFRLNLFLKQIHIFELLQNFAKLQKFLDRGRSWKFSKLPSAGYGVLNLQTLLLQKKNYYYWLLLQTKLLLRFLRAIWELSETIHTIPVLESLSTPVEKILNFSKDLSTYMQNFRWNIDGFQKNIESFQWNFEKRSKIWQKPSKDYRCFANFWGTGKTGMAKFKSSNSQNRLFSGTIGYYSGITSVSKTTFLQWYLMGVSSNKRACSGEGQLIQQLSMFQQ